MVELQHTMDIGFCSSDNHNMQPVELAQLYQESDNVLRYDKTGHPSGF